MKNETKNKKFPLHRKPLIFGACVAVSLLAMACTEDARAKVNLVFKDFPQLGGKSVVVAKINDDEITEDQLIGDAQLELLQIKKQEYDLKMGQLNKLITKRLLGDEARERILKSEIKITDAEFKKFIKEKNIPESNINDQVKERIYAYMKEQKHEDQITAAIAKITKNKPVEVYFKKPKSNLQIEVGNSPTSGGDHAAVTVTEFSDFQCPFCGRAATTVNEIKKKYGNKIKVVFKQFPLPKEMHKDAMPAAEASLCVNEQGKDKFWKFHDLAFANQSKLDSENLVKHAVASGADEKKFKECFESHKFAELVRNEEKYGEKIGVRSTPTFFINGQLLSGAQPAEAFSEVIDEELASAK